jgi:hypothetical protein
MNKDKQSREAFYYSALEAKDVSSDHTTETCN